jgi:hypothetical protein
MNENRQGSGFLMKAVFVVVLLVVAWNIYTGATVQEIGIPGLFTIEFGPGEQRSDLSISSKRINPVRVEAENYDEASAHVLAMEGGGTRFLGYINDGEWTRYDNINLGSGEMRFLSARVASAENGGVIEVHLDSPSGRIVGICHAPPTGGWETWQTVSCEINDNVTNVNSIYFVYRGKGTYLFNIDWLDFK